MTPEAFKDKWRNTPLTERQSYQSHFNDLCRLLEVPAPYEIDAEGIHYCFEKGGEKTTGKQGWADVWKRGCFGWEYKKAHADLTAAYAQLQQYAPALENPPLLIVCDTQRFVIHTNFTNTPRTTYEFGLADLVAPETRRRLRLAFSDTEWESGGAQVRVSLVGFGAKSLTDVATLDGTVVDEIHADLTAGAVGTTNLTRAQRLRANQNVAFMATTKGGAFDIHGDIARQWLRLPANVNRRPNSDVLRPWLNGMDVTRRSSGKWIIDFNVRSESDAAQYEAPFEHLRAHVWPERQKNRRESYRKLW